jgi:oxygen-independent coproporphyrinogen-3 oxidase
MDIILGLPKENIADIAHTMDEILKMSPDSITVHSLALKRASKLHAHREEYEMSHIQTAQEMMELVQRNCQAAGLKPYYLYRQKNMAGNMENVGYARTGKAGIYNILIMEEKQTIAALGAGSTSKAVFSDGRIERADNIKDAALYINRIDEMIGRKRNLFCAFPFL